MELIVISLFCSESKITIKIQISIDQINFNLKLYKVFQRDLHRAISPVIIEIRNFVFKGLTELKTFIVHLHIAGLVN